MDNYRTLLLIDSPDDARLISEILTDCELPFKIETKNCITGAIESLKEAEVTPDAVIVGSNILLSEGIQSFINLTSEPVLAKVPLAILQDFSGVEEFIQCRIIDCPDIKFITRPQDITDYPDIFSMMLQLANPSKPA